MAQIRGRAGDPESEQGGPPNRSRDDSARAGDPGADLTDSDDRAGPAIPEPTQPTAPGDSDDRARRSRGQLSGLLPAVSEGAVAAA